MKSFILLFYAHLFLFYKKKSIFMACQNDNVKVGFNYTYVLTI